jgi:cytochrome c oxidase subunit 2
MLRTDRRPLTLHAFLTGFLFASLGIGSLVYGTRSWLPTVASRHGAGIDAMLQFLLVAVGAMLVTSYLTLAWFIWTGARRTSITQRLASPRAEALVSCGLGMVMALVAEGGVLAIGMPVWSEYFAASAPDDALTIEVTAQQFMWNVRYPGPDGQFGRVISRLVDDVANPIGLDASDPAAADDILALNELTVPVGRPVRLRLFSKDVIHSFFLPHLRVKQDAVPGMSPEVVFVPTEIGSYEIACAELCGLAHYRMRGAFNVVRADDFPRWLEQQARLR